MPDITTTQVYIFMAAILVALIIMVVIAISNRRGLRQSTESMARWEGENNAFLDALRGELYEQAARLREETGNELHQMNATMMNTLTNMTQTQSMQLESVQRRMQSVGETQEQRLDRMQKSTEESLGKFDLRMVNVTRTLDEKLAQNENRIEKMRETLADTMGKLQTENAQKLEEMRKTVDEKLHDTLDKRLGESFSQVSKRLEEVYKGLGEMQTLASGVGDLKKVLTNVKTRGIWGEMQLGNLLSQILSPNQYEENVCVNPASAERVEFALRMPGRQDNVEAPVYLPIDSKFPQEDFLRLVEASEEGDAAKTAEARRTLSATLRTEAKRISTKYVAPPHTTDFAIMFLPLEGLYAEAMRSMDLVEAVQREYRVVIAGPSTLTALLNSLQMGFRTLAIEKRSAEVWKLLGAVKTDFGKFAQVLEKTQTRLRQASESIDSAYVRTRSIERQLRTVEALEEAEAQALLPAEGELDVGEGE